MTMFETLRFGLSRSARQRASPLAFPSRASFGVQPVMAFASEETPWKDYEDWSGSRQSPTIVDLNGLFGLDSKSRLVFCAGLSA